MYDPNNADNEGFGTSFQRQFKRGIGIGGEPAEPKRWKNDPRLTSFGGGGGLGGGPDGGPTSGGGENQGGGGNPMPIPDGGPNWRGVGLDEGDGGSSFGGGGGPMPIPDGGPNWKGLGQTGGFDSVGPGGGLGGPQGDGDGIHNPMPLKPRPPFQGTGQGGTYAPNRVKGNFQDPTTGVSYAPNHPNNPNSQAYQFLHPQAAPPPPAPFPGGNEMGGGQGFGNEGRGFGGGGPMPLPPQVAGGGGFNMNQHPKLQGMVDTFRQDHPRPEGGWNWGDINNLKRRRF